jgi:type IV pilus assembly protein PilO
MWPRLIKRERERKLALVLGASITAALFYLYLLSPQLATLGEIRREVAAVEQELAAAESLLAGAARQREALAQAEAELQQLRDFFAADVQGGALIVDVGLRAAEDGVQIIFFRPLPIVEADHLLILPLEIGVRGTYPAVLNYLKSLQSLPNISEIRQLSVREENQSPPVVVRADILLLVYADPSPAGRRQLAEMGHWLTGRYDVFQPSVGSPAPGVGPVSPGPELGPRPFK